ncbi:MAG: AMP-binding protein, partial [Actinomycetota bacterium]
MVDTSGTNVREPGTRAGRERAVGRDVAREREAIEGEIEGRTLVSALADTVARLGDAPALHWRDAHRWHDPAPGGWQSLSWRGFAERIRWVAGGLRLLGVERGRCVVLSAGSHLAHLLADQAALQLGATPVSLYPTLSVEQLAFHAGHCGARVAVVEGQVRLDRALAAGCFDRIVAVDATADDPRVVRWATWLEEGRAEHE